MVSVSEEEYQGTCDALRAVAQRIRGDFIFVGSDAFCQFNIGDLVQFHRLQASDVTMTLVGAPIAEPEKKGASPKLQIEEDDQEIIGIGKNGRVLLKESVLDLESGLTLQKSLVFRGSHHRLRIRSDLLDLGVYVFSHWVSALVVQNPHLVSVKSDLIPHLIAHQFQTFEDLQISMPSLLNRSRHLLTIDKWLVQQEASHIYNTVTHAAFAAAGHATTEHNPYRVDPRTQELCDIVLADLLQSEEGEKSPRERSDSPRDVQASSLATATGKNPRLPPLAHSAYDEHDNDDDDDNDNDDDDDLDPKHSPLTTADGAETFESDMLR